MMITRRTTGDMAGLSLRQLRERRRRIVRQIPDLQEVIAGSLQEQRRRCGRRGVDAPEESAWTLPVLVAAGRSPEPELYVPAELAEQVRKRMSTSAAVESALAEISAIN